MIEKIIGSIIGLFKEIWVLTGVMAPYLLFGFFVAGILYILIPKKKIYKHLSENKFSSIIKAALFGIPLPLCSCGVIPVAAHLRKEGAGKSATLTFLIAAPTTGVDSIMATYSLLGPLFAVIRPVADFFSSILAGVLSNYLDKEDHHPKKPKKFSCDVCEVIIPHTHSWLEKIRLMLKYSFFNLVDDVWKWLVIGIVIGGVISYLVPAVFIEKYLGNPFLAYPLMVLIGIPMYVCATGSIPIAASLIMKGMSPGAGLVFLITGPATNTATISFVAGKLGKKSAAIYLFSIITTAILFGLLIDYAWILTHKDLKMMMAGMTIIPQGIKTASSIILILLILRSIFGKKGKRILNIGTIVKVPEMECTNCINSIECSIRKLENIQDVRINLKSKSVEVIGDVPKESIIKAIKDAGFKVKE